MQLADEIRLFILQTYSEDLSAKGLRPETVPDNFDLLEEGVISSIGLLDIINNVEARFSIEVDLENMPAEELTIIGPLSKYIASCKLTD